MGEHTPLIESTKIPGPTGTMDTTADFRDSLTFLELLALCHIPGQACHCQRLPASSAEANLFEEGRQPLNADTVFKDALQSSSLAASNICN